MVSRIPVPAGALALRLLDRVDYGDAFEARTAEQHSPRDWVELLVAGASPALAGFVRFVHRRVGRMQLAERHAAGHPLGWTVLDATRQHAVLGVDGGIVTPRLVIEADGERVRVVTLLRYETRLARPLWWMVAPVHRAVARHLLAKACETHLARACRSTAPARPSARPPSCSAAPAAARRASSGSPAGS
jgi:hypothetical protein